MFHYEIIGEGKPIVMLHGLGCDLGLMKGCMEPLFDATSEYKRIYIDLLGMGQSSADLAYASADKMLEVLIAFIQEHVRGNFLLVGESYGGYLARGILANMREQVDGLMFICPVIIPQREQRTLPTEVVKFVDEQYVSELPAQDRQDFCEYTVVANETTHKRYVQEIQLGLQKANEGFISELINHYSFSNDVDEIIRKSGYSKPTLFVCGRQDDCVGYEDAYKLMRDYPRATYAVLDVGGHNLQIEQPRLFNELAWNWLERCENEK